MPNNLGHFAIDADDLPRARRFYEAVFGWQFKPWGPPDYLQIRTGDDRNPGVPGALQRRNVPLAGSGNRTFTCTIGVDSIEEIMTRVRAQGGRITMEPFVIVGVGTLIYLEDTECNRVGAMHYDQNAGVGE
jgi:predicted enzyme related to lactoylglutathione lyase